MAKYVDEQKVKRKLQYIFKTYGMSDVLRNKIYKALDDSATDAVSVVRCKDCKHWDDKYKCCIMMGLTAVGDSYFHENSFCSCGKRKEQE